MTEHRHEWNLYIGPFAEDVTIVFDAQCKHCSETIDAEEIERRLNDYERLKTERDALVLIKDEVIKLKEHLSPDGEYCITRADKEPMSWESLIIGDIMLKIDEALETLEAIRKEVSDERK